MKHEDLCCCSECRKLDRKHPLEGAQLAMFEQRTQRAPTEGEVLASLFALAGKDAAYGRNGQRSLIL
jgi:hypothetical protein